MNVLERMKANDTERKMADFKVKQQQPYEFKVAYAESRVWEFIKECGKRDLNTHVSVGRQPFTPGESSWIPKEAMKNIIEARKGNQLTLFNV